MYEPSRVISVSFALTAFAVAVLAGVAAGNPAATVLGRAIVALFIGQAVGLAVGAVGRRTMLEHVKSYQAANPIPDLSRVEGRPEKSTVHPVAGG